MTEWIVDAQTRVQAETADVAGAVAAYGSDIPWEVRKVEHPSATPRARRLAAVGGVWMCVSTNVSEVALRVTGHHGVVHETTALLGLPF